ncbi:MAG: Gfo/Idh/MocA family oxidoreductase [Clostridia bacterium]|nr:Gfo/Idh/MocA family oxidoreductase [Clostridia bacterium]
MKQFTAIVVGAGARGKVYTDIMGDMSDKFKVVGVAEPIEDRRIYTKEKHGIKDEYVFNTWEDMFAIPKFADIAIITTLDRLHTAPAVKALELGYDLLLEKPVAPTPEECRLIRQTAKKYGRKVLVCHTLRYTPFLKTLKHFLDEGLVGEVMSVEHMECVGNAHFSHSFTRGNWSNSEESSFMLLQKCCHDLDALQWLLDKDCKRIQSFGSRSYFIPKNAPEGSPDYCIDGCPAGDDCPYNAMKLYYADKNNHWFRGVAAQKPAGEETDCDVLKALRTTQYGKCVFKCNSDVVDHQTVNMEFEGGTTATLTMSAFAKGDQTTGSRRIRVMGTKGDLIANLGVPEKEAFSFYDFKTCRREFLDVDFSKIMAGGNGIGSHAGGDEGLVADLYDYLTDALNAEDLSEIEVSCRNHMLAFAAEDARLGGRVVSLDEYMDKYMD